MTAPAYRAPVASSVKAELQLPGQAAAAVVAVVLPVVGTHVPRLTM